jgi:hypothetical protein
VHVPGWADAGREQARVDVVPRILIGGGGNGGSGGPQGNVLEALLALMLSDRLGEQVTNDRPRDPAATATRDALRNAIAEPDEKGRSSETPRRS